MRAALPAVLASLVVATFASSARAANDAPAHPAAGNKADETKDTTPAPTPIVVWPTMTPAGDGASALPLHRPTEAEPQIQARAQELDATLRDAIEDLGYVLDVADDEPAAGHARDEDMLARASRRGHTAWVVSARLEPVGSSSYVLRIVAASPKGDELRVRVDRVKAEDVSVRGLVMLRDLLDATAHEPARPSEPKLGCTDLGNVNTTGLRSPGRAVLAVNGGLFGGYVAYSLQRASGSDDPQVLYPLLALGTGVGVGASLLVSDEWDLSTGDAWYLAAGAWWGAASGVLIANGAGVPLTNRYAYGVGSGLGGIALATFALTRSRMDDGDALLTHSGGAIGMFVGGLAELAYRGSTTDTPYTGAGLGAAVGVVGAGALSLVVSPSPSRVMLVDLGAALGGLAGAAAASPLVIEDVDSNKNSWFLAATLGGTVVGGGIAWILTRDDKGASQHANSIPGMPMAGVIGTSATPTGQTPAYGIGWQGAF